MRLTQSRAATGARPLLLVCAFALFAACANADRAGESAETRRVAIGAPAPAYSTVALNGDSVSLAKLRGKVVLLNIWATWCRPCRAEIPELQALHEYYAVRGLELVGVSVDADGSDDAIREFMTEFAMTFPVWKDPDERISARFLTVGVPTTFLIDREGVLRWKHVGPIAKGDTALRAAIEKVL